MCAGDLADHAPAGAIGDRLKDGTSARLMCQDEEASPRDAGVEGCDAAAATAKQRDAHEDNSAGDGDDR